MEGRKKIMLVCLYKSILSHLQSKNFSKVSLWVLFIVLCWNAYESHNPISLEDLIFHEIQGWTFFIGCVFGVRSKDQLIMVKGWLKGGCCKI